MKVVKYQDCANNAIKRSSLREKSNKNKIMEPFLYKISKCSGCEVCFLKQLVIK